jgi:hypothetical protein
MNVSPDVNTRGIILSKRLRDETGEATKTGILSYPKSDDVCDPLLHRCKGNISVD